MNNLEADYTIKLYIASLKGLNSLVGFFVPSHPLRKSTMRLCSALDCNRKHFGLGYCQPHYKRFKKTGSPQSKLPINTYGIIHGHGGRNKQSPTYVSWYSMHKRCKPTDKTRKYYYDKGIKVCKRWDNFEKFLSDMGRRPVGMTLDRINGKKGYIKSNCRWATKQTQMRNRDCKKYYYRGKKRSLAELAEISNVNYSALRARLITGGWNIEQAMTIPSNHNNKNIRKRLHNVA